MIAIIKQNYRRVTAIIPPWLIVLMTLFLVVAAFWKVFGLHLTGTFEEWFYYTEFDKGISTLSMVNGLAQNQADRILQTLCYELGYRLTPNSFVGLNLIAITVFTLRGFFLYGLLQRLMPKRPALAFATAILYLVFPADTSWYWLRFLAYQVMDAALLGSAYCLVLYWQTSRRWALVGMWIGLLICTGTAEVVYPLIAVAPLLLVWLQKHLSRRLFRVTALWYAVPIGMLIYTAIVFLAGHNTYQSSLVSTGAGSPSILEQIMSYPSRIVRMYELALGSGWWNAVRKIHLGSQSLLIAILVSIMVGIAMIVFFVLHARQSPPSRAGDQPSLEGDQNSGDRRVFTWRNYLRHDAGLLLVGLAVIGLGFLFYVPLIAYANGTIVIDYTNITDRVYTLSSIGAALCLIAVLDFVGQLLRHTRVVTLVGVYLLTIPAVSSGIQLSEQIQYVSAQQQRVLAEMSQQVPDLKPGAVVIVLTDSPQTNPSFWSDASYVFPVAVRYLYHQAVAEAYACNIGWTGADYTFPCDIGTDRITMTFDGTRVIPFTSDRLVIFNYSAEKGLTLLTQWPTADETVPATASTAPAPNKYDPYALIGPDTQSVTRAHTMFATNPFVQVVPHDEGMVHDVAVEYGGQTFQHPFTSEGWDYDWSDARDALDHVWLAPDQDYKVWFRLRFVSSTVQKGFEFRVNGQPIPLNVSLDFSTDSTAPGTVGAIYTGVIPRSVIALNRADTALTFHVNELAPPQLIKTIDSPPPPRVGLQLLTMNIGVVPEPKLQVAVEYYGANAVPHPVTSAGWNGQWSVSRDAIDHFWLAPAGDYQMQLRLRFISPEVQKGFVFSVNGQPIPLSVSADPDVDQDAPGTLSAIYSGVIPRSAVALNPNDTVLTYHVDTLTSPQSLKINDDPSLLGLFVYSLHITPAQTIEPTPVIPVPSAIPAVQQVSVEYYGANAVPHPVTSVGWDGQWSISKDATDHFWLAPVGDYQVQLRLRFISPEVQKGFVFSVNGQPIPLSVSADPTTDPNVPGTLSAIYTGIIPSSAVAHDLNDTLLTYHVDTLTSPQSLKINDDPRLLGLFVYSLHITPAQTIEPTLVIPTPTAIPAVQQVNVEYYGANAVPHLVTSVGWDGQWSVAKDATDHFWLAPTGDYQVQLRLRFISPEVQKGFVFSVNGQPIPLSVSADPAADPKVPGTLSAIYTGIIPRSAVALNPNDTLLTYHVDTLTSPQSLKINDDPRLLGLFVYSLNIVIAPHAVQQVDVEYYGANAIPHLATSAGWDGQWSISKDATDHFWLAPTGDYQVQLRLRFISPEVQKGFAFSVNGQPIPLSVSADPAADPNVPGTLSAIYTGVIPRSAVALNPSDTVLTYHVDTLVSPQSLKINDDPRLLGLFIYSLHVTPAQTIEPTPTKA
ncbi:MAG: hypothetical protein ACYDBJ_11970 [Aggregatilineales bacterium]